MSLSLGIDFGGTSVKLGLVRDGQLVFRAPSIPTADYRRADALLGAMLAAIKELRAQHPDLAAVGAGVPGFVDVERGLVHELTNVPGWREVALRELLARETGLPAFVENDANAMTYAEWKYGAGRGRRHVVCVTLGTGVGAGMILDGRLYRGAAFGAGEVGQMAVDPRDQEAAGNYGNYGALEKQVGNREIAARAAALYARSGRLRTPDECSPASLAVAAMDGDPIAAELWRETGELIGYVLADIVWLLNPDAIILGGGVAGAGELLFKPIRDTIRSRTAAVFHEKLALLPAELGTDAGLIGAAALAADASTAGG